MLLSERDFESGITYKMQ